MTPYPERIAQHLEELGIPPTYAGARGLPLCHEPAEVELVGLDIFGRAVHLEPAAAWSWRTLRQAAQDDGIDLLLVSAFRSVDYQRAIFDRKFARGLSLDDILRVNAAPGYSEHHTGRAVDIATRGCPPLTTAFDETDAFAWLTGHAAAFGCTMSYPPGNPYGFVYEPWHWVFREDRQGDEEARTPRHPGPD